jgi:hypothetical protein
MNRPFAHKPTLILELCIFDYSYSLPSGQTWYLPLQCRNRTIFVFVHWIRPNESFHRCVNRFPLNLFSLSKEANAHNRNFLISPITKKLLSYDISHDSIRYFHSFDMSQAHVCIKFIFLVATAILEKKCYYDA